MAPPFRDKSRGKGTVMDWARVLAYVTGTVDQVLLARNEYWAAENRILKAQGYKGLRSDDRQCPATPRSAAGAGAQAHDHMAGLHSDPLGATGGDRFLHRGGAHAARIGDLLRVILHPSREPPGGHRRDHHSPGRAVDEANGPE